MVVENFDIVIEYGSAGGVVLLVFVNQETSNKIFRNFLIDKILLKPYAV